MPAIFIVIFTLFLTFTSPGKPGCNVHPDKLNEMFVREIKDIMKSLQRSFGDQLLECAVAASNTLRIIKNHNLESLELSDLQGRGKHTQKVFSKDDEERTRSYIVKHAPFKTRDVKHVFVQKCLTMWGDMSELDFPKFVVTKRDLYRKHRSK